MKTVPIRQKDQRAICHLDWPVFYMNDFSQLGLLVDHLDKTKNILENNGYQLNCHDQGCELLLEQTEYLVDVCSLLSSQKIHCEMADLVSCVYQG